jgi:cytochrome c-type biogenesis protein CcsB
MAVYMLAFFTHIAEWSFGSRSKVSRTAEALTGKASESGEAATSVTSAVTRQVTVQARKGGSTTVIDRPTVVVRAVSGSRDVPDGPGADGGTVKGDLYGRMAVALTVLGFVVEASGVLARALSVGRAPWGNMYEFNLTFSSVAVGIYVVLLLLKKNIRWLGLPLVATVLLDLGLAVTVLYAASAQLVPALHSYWLWIHVSTAIFCGAVFYVGGVASALFIFRDRYEAKLASGGKPGAFATSVMERLPSAATLDKFAYRVNATVFPLWTFTIIAGAIWAGQAWGKYWGWDPKETWAFITWVAYACYLHARSTAGWKGRKAAYLALIAFACFLFNYYGVNIFVNSMHSYAGV